MKIPDPRPGLTRKKIQHIKAPGFFVPTDGEPQPVHYDISMFMDYADDGYPVAPNIDGRMISSDPYFMQKYFGKEGLLEMKDRQMSIWITDRDGSFAYRPGVVKGFPPLAEQGQGRDSVT